MRRLQHGAHPATRTRSRGGGQRVGGVGIGRGRRAAGSASRAVLTMSTSNGGIGRGCIVRAASPHGAGDVSRAYGSRPVVRMRIRQG
jgi:hypothetical protein